MTSTIRRPPEPITPADFRRAAVIRLGIVGAFFVANVAARFGIAQSSLGDLGDYEIFLAVSTVCHVSSRR